MRRSNYSSRPEQSCRAGLDRAQRLTAAMRRWSASRLAIALLVLASSRGAWAEAAVSSPPPAEVQRLSLSPHYRKFVSVDGFPIVGSARVSDHAMLEAAYIVRSMLTHRPDCLEALTKNKVRLAVMAYDEMTTSVPEHSDLTPPAHWDRRARGLGPTPHRPAVSCGEENLLCLRGDPYAAENILVHEFGHAIHEMGMTSVDKTFDARVKAAYESAKRKGLWKDTYAMTNHHEYWGEATQSWFDTNRRNDREHNDIDTREKLRKYDPDLAKLLAEVYGDGEWRYVRPQHRRPAERKHLEGFNAAKAPTFAWPKEKKPATRQANAKP